MVKPFCFEWTDMECCQQLSTRMILIHILGGQPCCQNLFNIGHFRKWQPTGSLWSAIFQDGRYRKNETPVFSHNFTSLIMASEGQASESLGWLLWTSDFVPCYTMAHHNIMYITNLKLLTFDLVALESHFRLIWVYWLRWNFFSHFRLSRGQN